MTRWLGAKSHISGLLRRETFYADMAAALGALLWSLWPSDPEGMVDNDAWQVATRLAGEDWWIVSGVVIGAAHVLALLRDQRICRLGMSFVACWWWAVLFGCLFATSPYARSLGLYLIMMLIHLFSLVRLKIDPPTSAE